MATEFILGDQEQEGRAAGHDSQSQIFFVNNNIRQGKVVPAAVTKPSPPANK